MHVLLKQTCNDGKNNAIYILSSYKGASACLELVLYNFLQLIESLSYEYLCMCMYTTCTKMNNTYISAFEKPKHSPCQNVMPQKT